MIFLCLSIAATAALLLIFKLCERLRLPLLQVIAWNYLVATICAFVFLPSGYLEKIQSTDSVPVWIPVALLMGTLFIAVFRLTGQTAVEYGASTASVAMKLGLVFPVALAFLVYDESFNWLKLLGILAAVVAVVLTSIRETGSGKFSLKSMAILPAIVFVGSGLCDSLTQLVNKRLITESQIAVFSLLMFAAAAAVGCLLFLYQFLVKKVPFSSRSLWVGIVLGGFNYLSFYTLLKSLSILPWGSGVIFPVANLGIVVSTTILGIVLFKERLSAVNKAGIGFAILAILLILFS